MNQLQAPDITVVIAAKNEVRTIEEVIRGAQKYAVQVIVVDGHSTDGTAELARRLGAKVLPDRGRGKGDAIRTAIPLITTEITVFMDADGSHDPNDIPKLVAPILADESDHVSGSRLLGGSSELHGGFDEFFRLAGSSFITACFNWRFGTRLSDSQNGFRAIATNVLRALNLRENITTIEQEMIVETIVLGYRLSEVPTHEHKRRYGQSHICLRKVWMQYLWSLARAMLRRRGAVANVSDIKSFR